jgi:hypothetical protein
VHTIDMHFDVTDAAGNTLGVDIPLQHPGAWTYVDHGTSGFDGMPELELFGSQIAGTETGLKLRRTTPGSICVSWIALNPTSTPLWNGTVHAFPWDSQIIVISDGDGEFSASTAWPAGIPSGTEAWWQFLVEDNSVIWGGTMSNAVKSTAP